MKSASDANSKPLDPLENWTFWLEEWRQMEIRLQRTIARPPQDLVMYMDTSIRTLNEDKILLEYAKINTNFDKYRGNPKFWRLPFSLTRCPPNYFQTESKVQKGILSLEQIDNPDAVKEEKNVLNYARNVYLKWQGNKYREEQMQNYAKRIEEIVPHRAKMRKMIVIGKSILTVKEEEDESEEKTESLTTTPVESFRESAEVLENRRVHVNIHGLQPNFKILLNYEYDISKNDTSLRYVCFENSGRATVRVSFIKVPKFRLFRAYRSEESFQNFFFDKNELLILPGHTKYFPIWFKSEESGLFSETWKLTFQPDAFLKNTVLLTLQAYSFQGDFSKKIESILDDIEFRTKNLLIADLISDLLRRSAYHENVREDYVYSEGELFEAANLVQGYPKFLYKPEIVEQLKNIYHLIEKDNSAKQWSFSIVELLSLARMYDRDLYLKRIDNLVSDKSLISTISSEGVRKKNESTHSKMIKTVQVEFSMQNKIRKLLDSLDSPIIVNVEREKFLASYAVMSAYFGKMSNLLSDLHYKLNVDLNPNFPRSKTAIIPLNQRPERIIYEKHFTDSYHVDYMELETYDLKPANKPKNLNDVNDPEDLYMIYFNKLPLKDPRHRKIVINSVENMIPEFDPYAEKFLFIPTDHSVIYNHVTNEERKFVRKEFKKDYKYKSYLLVYLCLSEAIDALTTTLSSYKSTVPYNTLNQIKEYED